MNFVLPVFLDSEVAEVKFGSGRADNLSRADMTRFLKIVCDRLQVAGIHTGIYASASWFKYQLDLSQLPFSIWVAQWSSKLTFTGDYVLWQYTDAGTVLGISGRVDISRRPDQTAGETVQETKAVQKTVTANVLNIRAEASASSADLGDLIKGSIITVDKTQGNWAHFEGWCSTSYLK